ncbi:MAG: tRNA (adenosine(37)-N6)-dimethylallyltransferase MiaA [Phycisphaerae bacterium]|nr:tRNA (adenosine(37)-N6)-dimethylallyltransferase MiaA [Phycisphaerae bacterium]
MLQRFPIIVGPTAGGKSSLAVQVGLLLRAGGRAAEIVTADSMQVFRGLDIGTAKPTDEERGGLPHHLIDIAEPRDSFSVERWLSRAEGCIDRIREGGSVPIVVGGTHFYVKALLEGLFEGPGSDEGLRAELAALPASALRAELERIDTASARRLHANDLRRTIRAIEVFRLTGKPLSEHQSQWDRGGVRSDALLVGLEWSTEAINRRINARVKSMIERGLVEEARGLWSAGAFGPQSREALGYKQLIEHFEGRSSLDEAIERIKIETRRFARNQRTWLRRLRTVPDAEWVRVEGDDVEGTIRRAAERVVKRLT